MLSKKTFHSLRSPPNCMRTVWYCLAWLAPHVVGFVIFDYSDIYSVLNLKMHCITIHVTCDVFGFDWANNLCRIILIEILENFESAASLILSSKTCVELILWIRTLKILFQTLLFHYCWWICFSLWFSRRFSRTKPTEYAAKRHVNESYLTRMIRCHQDPRSLNNGRSSQAVGLFVIDENIHPL